MAENSLDVRKLPEKGVVAGKGGGGGGAEEGVAGGGGGGALVDDEDLVGGGVAQGVEAHGAVAGEEAGSGGDLARGGADKAHEAPVADARRAQLPDLGVGKGLGACERGDVGDNIAAAGGGGVVVAGQVARQQAALGGDEERVEMSLQGEGERHREGAGENSSEEARGRGKPERGLWSSAQSCPGALRFSSWWRESSQRSGEAALAQDSRRRAGRETLRRQKAGGTGRPVCPICKCHRAAESARSRAAQCRSRLRTGRALEHRISNAFCPPSHPPERQN